MQPDYMICDSMIFVDMGERLFNGLVLTALDLTVR
jgi:hypothetical protein